MEVLACIPELPSPSAAAVKLASEPRRPVAAALIVSPEPTAIAGSVASHPVGEAADTTAASPAPQPGPARRSRPTSLLSPSIIALAVMAAFVWAAAWRNDHLRLEAARQQRPERLAQELPATAGVARSVTP